MTDDRAESGLNYGLGDGAEALRGRLRTLIKDTLPAEFLGAFTNDPADLASTEDFCKTLAAEGLLALAWPPEYGGAGGSIWEQAVVREEMWAHHEPRGPQYMGLNWVGPAVMRHGTAEQRAQHLPPISAGEVTWCQGFSEPEAGSDLASLRTRALPLAEGGWSITGQKVWTSYAQMAQWCVLAACTDPSASSSQRLTLFLVPMTRAGITVRPIPSMLGPHHLNEVFLDDLRVAPADVLGEVGDGWRVMRDAIAHERVGIARYARCESLLQRLMDELGDEWKALPGAVQSRWTKALIDLRVARLLSYAAVAQQQSSGIDQSLASLARILVTSCDQTTAEVLVEAAGARAFSVGTDAPLAGAIDDHWRYAQAATVSSGTIEVQRMLVAKQQLS